MPFRDRISRLRFPRRPRLQYSLRSLLIATVVLCLALGWHVERVRRQRRAVAALREAGARVEYSIASLNHYDMPLGDEGLKHAHGTEAIEIDDPRTVEERIEWLTPVRLRKSLGTDFFRRVEYINFHGVNDLPSAVQHLRDLHGIRILDLGVGVALLDDDLPALGRLRSLTHLDASFSRVTDAGLAFLAPLFNLEHLNLSLNAITGTGLDHLAHFHRLKYLDLHMNPMTDVGLVHLAKLRRIKELDLSSSKVTGSGLAHLAGMPDFESLDLAFTKLTDEHMIHLANFRQLKNLSLEFTAVGDAGLRNLRDLPSIESLDLGWTMVTDNGLESIRSLRSLKTLNLTGTDITDKGLRALGKLTSLKSLLIAKTAATPVGVAWLKRRLPKTVVSFYEQREGAGSHTLVLMQAGLWRQALEALGEFSTSYLESTDLLCELGQCHAGLAQWDEAERLYCQALEQISQEESSNSCDEEEVWRDLAAWPQLFERVARARPDDAWRWVTPARRAVLDGRWSDAVADYARAAACPHTLDPPRAAAHGVLDDSIDFEYGISRLFAGDVVGAQRVRDRLFEGDAWSKDFRQAFAYLDGCLLGAAHLQLLAPQGTTCPPAIAAWLRDGKEWYPQVLPLIYLRSGRFAQVLSEDQAGQREEDDGRFWFSHAMAHHYLKHRSEAHRCFTRGKQWLDRRTKEARIDRRKERPIVRWYDYDCTCVLLEAEVLRREAERLIFN